MRYAPLAFTALALAACIQPLGEPKETNPPQDSEADTDSDTDTDTDSDTDADTDSDTDADTDSDTDPGCGALALPMVRIEGGTFWMGSPSTEVGRGDDEDRHEVTLSHAFCLGVTEVDQALWTEVMGSPSAYFNECGVDCPAESMSWHEAAAFTSTLSAREHLDPCYTCTGTGGSLRCSPAGDPYTCEGYRLPTEAEWEKAARADSEAAFPEEGELPAGSEGACEATLQLSNGERLSELAWWCGNDEDSTQRCGVLAPSPAGLHDMSGNVWEWCHDGYGAYRDDATDPTGSAAADHKVLRGGSFASYPANLRAAARSSVDATFTNFVYGLRVARSVAP